MRLPGNGMSWREFFNRLKDEVAKDDITDWAATVTYYGVLALFPFLLFVVALASLFIAPSDAEKLVDQLSQVAPGAVTQIVGDRIRELATGQHATLVGFGALGAVWAASGAVTAVMRALNITYDVKEGRPFWKVRLVALGMTIFLGALTLLAGLVAVAAGPLGARIGGPLGTAVGWLRFPVAGLVMMFVWAVVYYVLPDVQQSFKFITPGSVVGVVVWVLASFGFSRYVSNFGSYDKTYGSLGSVIVLLLWMWISSLVVLVGAEINAVIEHRSPEGKRQGAKLRGDTGLEPARPSLSRAERSEEGVPPARPRPDERPRRPGVRGWAAVAAGFLAGVMLARRRMA